MTVQHYFSEDYDAARSKFIAACRNAGVEPERRVNPAAGPGGLELSTEIAYFGDPAAERLLVLISGVHGVETLCGSGCQTGLLAQGAQRNLPHSTALLLVHAINCWGAAHLRRNNEDNVDLCRNFLDFSEPLPTRPAYEQIHAALSCPELSGPRRDASERLLAQYRERVGIEAFIEALMGGQYQHPDGFAFGGHAPVWSNRTIIAVLEQHARKARQVCVVEYHSGLGPYAYGTAVTMHTGPDLDRARRWFGPWTLAPNERTADGGGNSHRVLGHSSEGYVRALPGAQVTSIVLEYGTYPPLQSLPVLIQDHWLAHFGDPASESGQRIRRRLLDLHYPKDPDWRQGIWDRSQQVVAQSLRGLSST